MHFLKLNTFKGKLYATAIVALLSMFMMFWVYNYGYKVIVSQMADNSFSSISEEMERRLGNEITRIEDASKLISYSATVQEYLLIDDPIARLDNLDSSLELMDISVQSSNNIVNITVIPRNGRNFLYYNGNMQKMLWEALDYYGLSDDITLNESFFSKIYYYNNDINDAPYCYYFMPIYNILPGEFMHENIAICAVLCNLRGMAGDVAGIFDNGVSALMYGNEIIASNRELDQMELYVVDNSEHGPEIIYYKGTTCFVNSISVPDTDWRYIAITTQDELTKNLKPLRRIGIILMFVSAALISIILAISIRSITKPLNAVIHDMESLQCKDGGARIQVPKEAEISQLANEINSMLEHIEISSKIASEAQNNLYKSILAQQKAELLSYRSQIKPHFLFNTLECLRSMAHEHDIPEVEGLCVSLASLFHYSLSSGAITDLGKEIENTKNYFNVMSQRFPGRYRLIINIPPEIISHPIPTMVLQPIVENCIMHGFKQKKPPCIIKITASVLQDDTLLVKVIDNGMGMTSKGIEKVNSMLTLQEDETSYGKNSIGLFNINQRMLHLFGVSYKLTVKSSQGHYTIVEMSIPMDSSLSIDN